MQMDSVLTAFRNLCDTPVGWIMLALVSLKTLHSIVSFLRCPLLHGQPYIAPERARALLDNPMFHSPRFLGFMLSGIALAVGGLYSVQNPEIGHFAIAAIVLGVFVMLVEPSRLSIDENGLRVAALGDAQGETRELALDRLRAAHLERLTMEVLFAIGLGAVVALY
jgi:hypothetical protein